MKYFLPMLCVVAAGGAGYVFEPKITPNLLSSSGGQNQTLEAIEKDGKIIIVPADSTPAPAPVLPCRK